VELLQQVGLGEEFLDRFPHELSGGQRQRLGIARALSTEPDILIADEAVSALDAETRMKVLDLLRDIQNVSGLPILFITHDFSVVTTIANRVAVMRSGRIIEEGRVNEVIQAPKEAYTRDLISAAVATV
jgi:ABC-type oligopeptide transport system ATPase subunit